MQYAIKLYMSPALLTVSAIFELVRYFPVGPTQNPRPHGLSLCSLSEVIRSNETSSTRLCFITNFDYSTINPRTFTGLDETIRSKIVLLEVTITSLRYATLKSDVHILVHVLRCSTSKTWGHTLNGEVIPLRRVQQPILVAGEVHV